jgi:hypothetical protein
MKWLSLFNPSAWAIKLAAIGALVAAILGAGWYALHQADQRGHARAVAEQAQAAQAAQAKARAAELAHADQVAQIKEDFYASTNATNQSAQSARTELARLKLELDRLRGPINPMGPMAPTTPGTAPGLAGLDGLRPQPPSTPGGATQGNPTSRSLDDPTATAWALLGQCAEQHVNMAGQADRIADQLRALQAWALSLKSLE